MPLSGELLALHEREDTYRGDPALVRDYISNKYLHMLAAPTKTGKSHSLALVMDILPDSAIVGTITSRERKYGDPTSYRTLSEGYTVDRMKRLITDDELVNYAVFPTGDIYGTDVDSYPATHNFLPTMTTGIVQLEHAGFKDTTLTYLVMAATAWEGILGASDFKGKAKQRMEEAIVSLHYAEDHMDTMEFVRNNIGYAKKTASDIATVAITHVAGIDKNYAAQELKEMLAVAKKFAVQSK